MSKDNGVNDRITSIGVIPSQQRVAWAFGQVLVTSRRMAKVSQEELAFRAGLDRTYPSLIERGLRQPTIGRLIAIGIALNMEPSVLVMMTVGKLREARL